MAAFLLPGITENPLWSLSQNGQRPDATEWTVDDPAADELNEFLRSETANMLETNGVDPAAAWAMDAKPRHEGDTGVEEIE